MGLFLPYKKMWDMPLDGDSDEKHIPHWFGNFAGLPVALVLKILFRYSVKGRENLRAFKGVSGVVLTANHTSYMDVVFLWLAVRPKQWVRWIARENLFQRVHGLGGQVISRVGAFPIKRDSADMVAIKRAAKMLKNHEVVGVLPEGTRRGKGSMTPEIHSGVAFIARMGRAPILPATVRNAEKIKRKGERMHFPKVSIEFGTPILLSDFDFLPKEDRLEGCSWYVMRACFALSEQIPAEEVDMVSLFPDAKDYTQIFREHPIPVHTSEEVVALYSKQAKPAAKTKKSPNAGSSVDDSKQG